MAIYFSEIGMMFRFMNVFIFKYGYLEFVQFIISTNSKMFFFIYIDPKSTLFQINFWIIKT